METHPCEPQAGGPEKGAHLIPQRRTHLPPVPARSQSDAGKDMGTGAIETTFLACVKALLGAGVQDVWTQEGTHNTLSKTGRLLPRAEKGNLVCQPRPDFIPPAPF